MRVLITPDSFKEALTAQQVADSMCRGVREVWPGARVTQLPLADGGEGTLEALTAQYAVRELAVRGPLGKPAVAKWGWDSNQGVALIEAAQAVGLELIEASDRDPENASTFGVGQLVLEAARTGARQIVLAVGGTGTNDGGAGLLSALGVRFLDREGNELPATPNGLRRLFSINADRLQLPGIEFVLATDVDNPLLGERGATRVYGPQKGVANLEATEAALENLARIAESKVTSQPGAGAAGGLGWAAMHFLGATRISGADLVASTVGLEVAVASADLILTGEGRVDGQTLSGKTVGAVLHMAHTYGVPAAVIAGRVELEAQELLSRGAAGVFALGFSGQSLSEDLANTAANLQRVSASICLLVEAGQALRNRPSPVE